MLLANRLSSAVNPNRIAFRASLTKLALVGIGVAFLTVLVVLPLASMFQYVSSNGVAVFRDSISSPGAVFSLKFAMILAVATTLITSVMGTVGAFILVRHDFALKGVFDSLVDLPIAIPAAATGFTLLLLYGPFGMVGKHFHVAGINIVFAFPGILIAHVFITLPFVVRAVIPVLRQVDKSQEEAAKTMGANEAQIFANVILPSIQGGLISGSIFSFARSLGEFGATIMVSGYLALQTQTAPMFIFSEFNRGDIEAASSMSVVLVIISLALFLGLKLIVKMSDKGSTASVERNIS